jgi:multidrug efflux system membrane fusion protein
MVEAAPSLSGDPTGTLPRVVPAGSARSMKGSSFVRTLRRWIWLVAVVVLGGAGAFFLLERRAMAQSAAHGHPSPPPLAVATVTARKGDIGVHLDALGTVTPLATVTVRTRVDGQLLTVNYREGQMVRAGAVLAELDARPFQALLVQAQGQYQRDKALLENARVDLDRYRSLFARDAIPKQILDTQVAAVHQFEGTVKFDQGQIANAKVQLAYCRITAPVAGRVGLRLVDPGNIVHALDTTGLVTITQLQPITVVFSVAEDFLPEISHQQSLGRKLAVDAFDRSQQKRLASGEVLTLDNQIDPTTGTIKVKALFANQDGALFPNQFVNARLQVVVHQGATLVPSAAVQRSAQGAFVYLVKSDQTVSSRTVQVGAVDGDTTEIVSGLAPGDIIAADNFDKLQDGLRIAPGPRLADATAGNRR